MTKDFAQGMREMASARENEPFKKKDEKKGKKHGIRFWLVSFVLGILSLAIYGLSGDDARPITEHEEWLPVMPLQAAKALALKPAMQKITLKSGDSSLLILKKLGFTYQQVSDMAKAAKPVYSLTHVRAGHTFMRQDQDDGTHVWYGIDAETRLHLRKTTSGWQAKVEPRLIWYRQRYAEVTIHGSLFLDASKAGIDGNTIMNLVDIFAWDIDFVRELRQGDHFKIWYEEHDNAEGKQIGSTILAAEFVNQGRSYSAVRYALKNGETHYYSYQGDNLRKTYLKAPVKFTRISSRFTYARKHPVLGYTRAHKGVDYAAPTGTPIHAIGDGRITFAGWKGGYGRLVKIRHTNRNHSTRYGHMSKFGRGIHKGVWVKQGRIIGYVGMSGLATGPHLHFEFRVRGRAINPLSVKHPPAEPVPRVERAAFKKVVRKVQEEMLRAEQREIWG